MAHRVLGDGAPAAGEAPIDIHAGGVDLIFPHHENEIAQSEGATGKPFSRFWVHVEHLMIEESSGKSDKMSKSLGNVYNLQDIIDQGFRPSALRYLYLGVHYRKQLRFSWAAMEQSEEALRRLTDFLARLDCAAGASRERHDVPRRLAEARRRRSAATSPPTSIRRARSACCSIWCASSTPPSMPGSWAPRTLAAVRDDVRAVRPRARRPGAAQGRGRAPAGAGRRDRAADRRPARRPAGAQLRRGRSHPQGPREPRHHPRRHRLDHALEKESSIPNEGS